MGAGGRRAWSKRACLLALLVSGGAQAAEAGEEAAPPGAAVAPAAEPAPASAPTAPAPCPGGEACEEEAAPAEEKLQLHLNGRVFARAEADGREDYARTLSIPSARVGLEAQWGLLSGEVSAELASSRILRDAFLRMRDERGVLGVRAGQFKAPFMARALLSAWDMPIQQRGLVEDYLVDTHGLGGRRPGLMLEVRPEGWARLRTAVGVFRGARDELGKTQGEDVAARATVRPFKGLDVGASGYAADVGGGAGRRWAGGGDVAARFRRVHLTAEVLTGQLSVGRFVSQTALAWVDVPLSRHSRWRLQPVVGAEGLQLSGEQQGQGWAVLGGVNALYGDYFKVLLQAERAFRPGDPTPGTALGLQLAARFK